MKSNKEIALLRAECLGGLRGAANILNNYADRLEDSYTWHQAEEKPNHTDGWFLAVTKDGQPFLTHYINGWVSQVYLWQYIELPV